MLGGFQITSAQPCGAGLSQAVNRLPLATSCPLNRMRTPQEQGPRMLGWAPGLGDEQASGGFSGLCLPPRTGEHYKSWNQTSGRGLEKPPLVQRAGRGAQREWGEPSGFFPLVSQTCLQTSSTLELPTPKGGGGDGGGSGRSE